MPRYEVEFASFRKVTIEAETEAQANDKAAVMEDEDIERDRFETTGYMIWNEATEVK
ncbi:hypothetical protein [Lacrimispora sp.]|uniref:hypothetical protein n=1 Tax=Lacrimispora sp. TaxID=2719234 RepID=UPI0034600FDF